MSLADLIRGKRFAGNATATLATLPPFSPPSVASVATVAVANSQKTEIARCWRVVSADGEQLTVTVSPEATRAEILKLYSGARVSPFSWPVRKPDAPLTAEEEGAIRAWLDVIEETDPASIASTIEQCQQDGEARAYFLGRAAVELPKPATEEKEP
jgi:hypothetical protein